MVVETRVGDMFQGEVFRQIGAFCTDIQLYSAQKNGEGKKSSVQTHLNCLSSSMTCTPCS
jgi:hypothetical protein